MSRDPWKSIYRPRRWRSDGNNRRTDAPTDERAKLEDRVADPRRQNIIGLVEPIREDDYDA